MTSTAALTFEYDEVDVPAATTGGGKEREPNPHTDAVMRLHALVVESGAVKAYRIAVPVQDGENGEQETQKAVQKHVRFLRAVGDDNKDSETAAPFTVKTKVADGERNIGTTKTPKMIPVKEIRFWIYTTEKDGKPVPSRITRKTA